MDSNKPTRSKQKNKKINWFAYTIVFFSGILITIFITFPLNDQKEQDIPTDKIELGTSSSEPVVSETSPKTKELTVSESIDYPYQVNMENITANRFIFRPKGGDSVGSLNKNRTVVIENTDVENKYIVSLSNSYHDAYTDVSSRGTYKVKKETIPTLEINVSSFGGTPDRNVKVNTQLTFNEQLSSVGDEFGPLIGYTMWG